MNGVGNPATASGAHAAKKVKKHQTLSAQFPLKVSLSAKTISITYAASSGLRVSALSASSTTCSIANKIVSLKGVGACTIRLSQAGNIQFLRASTKQITTLIQGENQISFTPSNSLLLSTSTYFLVGTSTSSLPLTYSSSTPDVCSISESTLTLIKLGMCAVRASQSGSNIYPAAANVDASITVQGSNQISFNLPSSLLFSSKTYPFAGISTSGLPLTYESLTPDICSVAESILTLTKLGLCTVRASQSGSEFYEAAQPVDASITISDTRVTSDQSDAVTGFQLKAIYVVPSDGTDHSYDTNGYIAGILDEGNVYLHSQLGLQIPVDKTGVGYDIQYLKSNLPTSYFLTASDLTEKLLAESHDLENPGINRKDYIFFVDVGLLVDGKACGIGITPGMSAVVAIGEAATESGSRCTGCRACG